MDPPRYGRPPSPLRAPSPLRVPAHPSTSVGSSFYSGEPSSLPTRGFYGGAQRSVGAQSPPCALYQPEWHPTGPFGHGYDGGYQQQQQRSFSTQVQPQPLHLPSRRSSLPLGGRVPAQPYARPPHARSTSFSQSPPSLSPLSLQDLYSPTFDETQEEGDRKRRPKTPPDCCSVCGSTSTPEWRKGPSGIRELCNGCGLMAAKRAKERAAAGFDHPDSIATIVRELQGIGEERFKIPQGAYSLPANTPARIIATQARTREQERRASISKPRAPKAKWSTSASEREAAESLVGFSRRASISHQSPPGALATFGGRRSSISNAPGATIYSAPRPRRPSTSSSNLPSFLPSSGPSHGFPLRPPSPVRQPSASGFPSRRPPSPARPRTPTSFGSQSTSNRMGLGFITNPTSPGSATPAWSTSSVRSGSPAGRLSMADMQVALERRRSQQY